LAAETVATLPAAEVVPGVTVRLGTVDGYRPQAANANQHTARGIGMLRDALREDGYVAPLTVAADGEALDGSARLEVLAGLHEMREALVVEHDGRRPIIMVRRDIPDAKVAAAQRIALRANRIAEVDLNWSAEVLGRLGDGLDVTGLWTDREWAFLVGERERFERSPGEMDEGAQKLVDEFSTKKVEVGDANWFFVEYYGAPERFQRLRAMVASFLRGEHDLDRDLFEEMVNARFG